MAHAFPSPLYPIVFYKNIDKLVKFVLMCLMCSWHAVVEVLRALYCAELAAHATIRASLESSMHLFSSQEQSLHASCLHRD